MASPLKALFGHTRFPPLRPPWCGTWNTLTGSGRRFTRMSQLLASASAERQDGEYDKADQQQYSLQTVDTPPRIRE